MRGWSCSPERALDFFWCNCLDPLEWDQSRRGWSQNLLQAGGGPYRLARAPGSFQPAAYALGLGASRSLHCTLEEQSLGFLWLSGRTSGFSNQSEGLVFLMPDPRAGMPNVGCDPLAPQEGFPACDSPSSSWLPTRDTGPEEITSPPSKRILCVSFFISLVVEDLFCKSSERAALYVAVVFFFF